MFRVEANTSLTSDPVYIFSIDGVKFEQFMTRDEAMRMPKQEEVQKRPSVTNKLPPAQRSGSITNNKPAVATNTAQKVVTKTESDLFDPFAPAPEAASASVDPFAPTPAAPVDAFSAGASDPFAPTPAAAPSSQVDPFAPSQSAAAFPTSSFESSGPSDDPFFSGASTAKKPFAPPAGSQATFATQASNSAPARRQSAIEIMGDFAGMTADAPPPPKASVMLPEPPKTAVETTQGGAPAKTAPTDPWASLVDLDLNKKGPSEQHAQRRASINAGPALSSQMKGDDKSNNNRRGSMPAMPSGNINPFGPSSAPQNGGMPQNGGDPFAAVQQPYQQQQPFGKPQYGQGMGSGPVNPFGAGGPAPNQGMNQGYGGGMNSGYGGNSMGMGGGYGAPAGGYGTSGASGYQQQPPQKRSSLDSLDPFKM